MTTQGTARAKRRLQLNHATLATGHDSHENSDSSSSMGAVLAGIIESCAGTCCAVTPSRYRTGSDMAKGSVKKA